MTTDKLLARLRDRTYDMYGQRTVEREHLDALIECAEAARFYRDTRICQERLVKAVAKLEAL